MCFIILTDNNFICENYQSSIALPCSRINVQSKKKKFKTIKERLYRQKLLNCLHFEENMRLSGSNKQKRRQVNGTALFGDLNAFFVT